MGALQVFDLGIGKYNEACRSIVTKYVSEWEAVVTRSGRWIDFKNGYKTMDLNFMESVWWVFAQLWEKDLIYKGFKVMPYSTGCKTALSNFEATQEYRTVPDLAVMVSFPIIGDADNSALVAWTTTPWTLPSNLALCVNANLIYAKVKDKSNGAVYVIAESRLGQLPVKAKASGKKQAPSKGSIAGAVAAGYSNIFVTVPSPENLKTLFDFVCKGINALEYKEHLHYDVVKSADPELKKATIQIKYEVTNLN
jgi:isoleucyl-tRNA synthetase